MRASLPAIRQTSHQSSYEVDAADAVVAHPHPVTASGPSLVSRPSSHRYHHHPNRFVFVHSKLATTHAIKFVYVRV